MAARAPRKLFASPFVVTLAVLPAACFSGTTSPQVVPSPQPSEPGGEPAVVTDSTPPRGSTPSQSGGTPEAQTSTFDQRWTVMKSGDSCSAMTRVECPKPTTAGGPVPTCNPPPPMKVACPDGWDGKAALTIVQYANQPTCMVEPPPMKCPQGAACNPPPPRKVACPTYQ